MNPNKTPTILDKSNEKLGSRLPPHPHFIDRKMARFVLSVNSSLILGGGEVSFLFCSVLDCKEQWKINWESREAVVRKGERCSCCGSGDADPYVGFALIVQFRSSVLLKSMCLMKEQLTWELSSVTEQGTIV